MTTEEHLNKIIAKCRELLAGAEKRTPGRWGRGLYLGSSAHVSTKDVAEIANCHSSRAGLDASFITFCAGPAEAGWRATIGMCEQALSVLQFHSERPSSPTQLAELETIEFFAETLIAAWPEELL